MLWFNDIKRKQDEGSNKGPSFLGTKYTVPRVFFDEFLGRRHVRVANRPIEDQFQARPKKLIESSNTDSAPKKGFLHFNGVSAGAGCFRVAVCTLIVKDPELINTIQAGEPNS